MRKGLPEEVSNVGRMDGSQLVKGGGWSILNREIGVCEFQVMGKNMTSEELSNPV